MDGFFASSTIQKEEPSAGLLPRCGSCGLYKSCTTPKMKVRGQGARGVLIVGEAPGEEDDDAGRPFAGEVGKMLRTTLREIDVDLDRDVWTTNALICHTKMIDSRQIDYCRPNLTATIKELEPLAIIPLGRVPLVSLLAPYWKDVGAHDRWTGWQIPLPSYWVCPTFHPRQLFTARNSLMDRRFADHLRDAFELHEVPPKLPDFREKIELLFEEDAVLDALQEIDEQGGWVATDYESNCLKPEYPKAKLYSCAVSNGRRTISYPWWGKAVAATGRFLQSDRTRKIAANLKFEERFTRFTFGHGVTSWGWDTMLAAHCLDNRQGICSLKFQALVKLGVPSYNDHIVPYLTSQGAGLYNRIHQIAIKDLLFYGGLDSLLEHRLAMLQRKEMGYES